MPEVRIISLHFIMGKSPVPRPNTRRITADMLAIAQKQSPENTKPRPIVPNFEGQNSRMGNRFLD